MKKIVFREGFHLSRIGIPIGILAGAIAGYVLVPQGWNTLMVFVIAAVTALFVYLCVMIAVIRGYSATLFKRKLRAKAWKRAQNRLYNLIETRKYGESMVHS